MSDDGAYEAGRIVSQQPDGSDSALPVVTLFCVHGIGVQAEGQTAAEVRTAVQLGLTTLGGEHRPSTAESAVGVPDADEDVVQVAGHRLRIRYRDGWWDERAVAPSAWQVLGWMFRVAPFALWGTATLWMTDLVAIAEAAPDRPGRRDSFPVPLVAFVGLTLAIVGGPAVMLLALPLLAVALMLPPTRRWAQRILQRYIGDAWSYRSDQLDDDVIGPMRADVAAERDAADMLVLVGHSQGAEIARRVALTEAVNGCVWIGSGEAQLGMLRTLRRSRLLPFLLWPYLLISPALITWCFMASFRLVTAVFTAFVELLTHPSATISQTGDVLQSTSDALLAGLWPSTLPLLATGAVFAAMSLVAAKVARHPADALQQPAAEVIVVKSLVDPVCFGTSNEHAVVRYVPLPKKRYWLYQHLRYFTSPITGIAILEAIFGTDQLGVTPTLPTLGKRAKLLGATSAAVAASVTLIVGLSELHLLHRLI